MSVLDVQSSFVPYRSVHAAAQAAAAASAGVFAVSNTDVMRMCAIAGWVKLLDNAAYGGTWDTEYTTLRGGSFTKLKAVHRSGFVACSTNAVIDGSPWQECTWLRMAACAGFALSRTLAWCYQAMMEAPCRTSPGSSRRTGS